MDTIQVEHVAQLLRAQGGDPVLIVLRGRVDVVAESALDDPQYAGALRVAHRDEVAPEQAGEPTDEEVRAIAQRLDVVVRNQGG